jgi:hypothetical protein
MSWLCLFTLSCLANPAAPMTLPTAPDLEMTPVSAHVRPGSRSSASTQPLSCELRQTKRDGEQMLVAVLRAKVPVAGEYEFSLAVKDAGRNNVSSSTGDRFRIKAGQRIELDGPSVSLGHDAKLAGHLELSDEDGKPLASCAL